MYVCLCKGITDGQIKQAVAATNGSFKAIVNDLQIAKHCGQCAQLALEIYQQAKADINPDQFYSAA